MLDKFELIIIKPSLVRAHQDVEYIHFVNIEARYKSTNSLNNFLLLPVLNYTFRVGWVGGRVGLGGQAGGG